MITQMRKNSNAVDLAVAMVVEGCNIIMQRMVEVIMTVAPYGVFCLIANLVGTTGVQNLKEIFSLVLTMGAAPWCTCWCSCPCCSASLAALTPSSSSRTLFPSSSWLSPPSPAQLPLPVTMEVSKEKNGVPDDVVNLCAAPAATINMDGAAIEYTVYTLFAATPSAYTSACGRSSSWSSCAWSAPPVQPAFPAVAS